MSGPRYAIQGVAAFPPGGRGYAQVWEQRFFPDFADAARFCRRETIHHKGGELRFVLQTIHGGARLSRLSARHAAMVPLGNPAAIPIPVEDSRSGRNSHTESRSDTHRGTPFPCHPKDNE